jgi:diguanylate cyclase (GGDEF)-like protein
MSLITAALLLAAVGGLTGWLWTARLLRAERARCAAAEQYGEALAVLAASTVGCDWQRSIRRLLEALVRPGYAQEVRIYCPAGADRFELQALANSPGMPDPTPLEDADLREALASTKPSVRAGWHLVPILAEGERMGVLAVWAEPPAVRESLLTLAGTLAAVALMGLRQQQRQLALSNTDGLTGLANHRYFQQQLGIAIGQSYLDGEPMALILLDIDHFKSVNDTYGHLVGDQVLREIAGVLRRELPPDGLAARYGGEELAIMLRGDSARDALSIAERLRVAIAGTDFVDPSTGSRLRVTVSLGVAYYELGQGKNRLIARADEALYTSKREGRNRVTVALPENSTFPPVLA